MLTFWVVVKVERTAEITAPTVPESGILDADVRFSRPCHSDKPHWRGQRQLKDNMEIWLINQTHRANGVLELSASEALMNAAQICSD